MKKRNLVGRAHEMEAQKKRRKTNNRSAEYRRRTELRHSNQLQSRTFDHLGVIEERQEVENIFYDTKTWNKKRNKKQEKEKKKEKEKLNWKKGTKERKKMEIKKKKEKEKSAFGGEKGNV